MDNKFAALYEKLSRLQWLFGRQHLQNHLENGPFADPSRGQGRVLAILKMQPKISTKDLSYLLGIRQQSLNELLNKLEKTEYVVREPSETDRRVMMVKLTEKGQVKQQSDTAYSGIFDCLLPEELVLFENCLDRVIAALESQLGTEADEKARADWANAARARLGDEQFEQLMSMRRGVGRDGHGSHGLELFGEFRPDERGLMPEDRGLSPFDRHPDRK